MTKHSNQLVDPRGRPAQQAAPTCERAVRLVVPRVFHSVTRVFRPPSRGVQRRGPHRIGRLKRLALPCLAGALLAGLGAAASAQELVSAMLPPGKSVPEAGLPKIGLFTTGGTIQSKGEHRQKIMEYGAGRVTPDELLADLPELADIADVEVTEISNIGSGGITQEHQLQVAKAINQWLARPDTTGAVVTHGTGTLEETAYFLNLTVRSEKPVVVVGAMRPFTAVSRDGPFNLYNAVRVAASPDARDMGVLIMLNDEINAARDTTKSNTYRMETFVARDLGPLGYADSDRIVFYRRPIYRHTHESEFDVSDLTALPRVDVTYDYQEDDGVAIDAFVAAGAQGIVLTGSDQEAVKRGQEAGVVFVQSDRKGAGRVAESARRREQGIVTADNLPPHKARILLRLALTKTTDLDEIQRMFNEY